MRHFSKLSVVRQHMFSTSGYRVGAAAGPLPTCASTTTVFVKLVVMSPSNLLDSQRPSRGWHVRFHQTFFATPLIMAQ
jgi:hypothetical protein